MRIALTDRRILVLKTSRMTSRSKGEVERDIPLRDVVAVHTEKRRSVATVGIRYLAVAVVLSNGHSLAFETGAFGIKAMQHLLEALETAARTVPGTRYGSDIDATD